MAPCKNTAGEVSFEWSHHRISSTDFQVRTTLHATTINSGSERRERVKTGAYSNEECFRKTHGFIISFLKETLWFRFF